MPEIINKIDLMNPVRMLTNKENWKKSLLIWLFIFFIFGAIKSILKFAGTSDYVNSMFVGNIYASLLSIIGIILKILTFGYKRVYLASAIQDNDSTLPEINYKQIINIAFKLILVLFPIMLFEMGLIWEIVLSTKFLIGHQTIFNVIIVTAIVILFILVNIFAIFVECAYLQKFNFKEGFKYIKIWKKFKLGWIDVIKTYFMAFLIITPIVFAAKFLNTFFIKLNIPNAFYSLLIFSNFYYFIFDLIKMNFVGQVYKNVLLKYQDINYINKISKEKILTLIGFICVIVLLVFPFVILLKTLDMEQFGINHPIITHSLAIETLSMKCHIPKIILEFGSHCSNYTLKYLLSF